MKALILALVATLVTAPQDTTYSVWSEGIHLIMSDNGTPDDYDDDWAVDWEDNRVARVFVID